MYPRHYCRRRFPGINCHALIVGSSANLTICERVTLRFADFAFQPVVKLPGRTFCRAFSAQLSALRLPPRYYRCARYPTYIAALIHRGKHSTAIEVGALPVHRSAAGQFARRIVPSLRNRGRPTA